MGAVTFGADDLMVAFTDKVSPYISPMTLAVFEDRSVNAPPRHCQCKPHTRARVAPRTQFMRHLRSESLTIHIGFMCCECLRRLTFKFVPPPGSPPIFYNEQRLVHS